MIYHPDFWRKGVLETEFKHRGNQLISCLCNEALIKTLDIEVYMSFTSQLCSLLLSDTQCPEGHTSWGQWKLLICSLPRFAFVSLAVGDFKVPFSYIKPYCEYNSFQGVLWAFLTKCQTWKSFLKTLKPSVSVWTLG